ncbi:hypothetical protein [Micromonospora sp. NPDC003241]
MSTGAVSLRWRSAGQVWFALRGGLLAVALLGASCSRVARPGVAARWRCWGTISGDVGETI